MRAFADKSADFEEDWVWLFGGDTDGGAFSWVDFGGLWAG